MPPPRLAVRTCWWRLSWGYEGRCRGETGFHLVLPSTEDLTFPQLHELHEDLSIWSDLFWRNHTADTVTLDLSRLYFRGVVTSLSEVLHLSTPAGAGGYGGSAGTAVHVRQIVQGARKGEHGHFFLPPPPVSEIDFGAELTTGYISSLSSALDSFRSGVEGIVSSGVPSVEFCVVHRSSAGVPVDPPVARPVDSWVITPKLSVQRRRLDFQVS